MLTEPLSYKDLVYVLLSVDMVATDSGGIQEEAVSLGKPVAVLREKSERMEGVWAGLATLVGTNEDALYAMLTGCVAHQDAQDTYNSLYGDGHAAEKIVRIIQQQVYASASASVFDLKNIQNSHKNNWLP
jgi:UDP-N-acetylglucosamine 2-epimerase (non-hydrolysing)